MVPGQAGIASEIIDRLIEGDLNDLGLQVIWVNTHGEVADAVADLATARMVAAA